MQGNGTDFCNRDGVEMGPRERLLRELREKNLGVVTGGELLSGKLDQLSGKQSELSGKQTAAELGRLGGRARAERLSAEERREIARKGGLAGGRGRSKG